MNTPSIRSLLATAALFTCLGAQAANSIVVTEPGDDGYKISTNVVNTIGFEILSLTFDFTGVKASDGSQLIIDGSPLSTSGSSGVTSSFFGSGAVFGFDFTGFTNNQTFTFAWDPDSLLNSNYGATGLDFINGKVTAVTSGGTFSGTFAQVMGSPDVAAVMTVSSVPEASTTATMALGLAAIGLVAARRRKA